MRRHDFAGAALATVALTALLGGPAFERAAVAQDQKAGAVLPIFEVDPHFPTMPDHMLLGGVGGATADSHGNVWVLHRPHTLEEGNVTQNGYVPAPPVLQFSPTGRYIGGWGGPAKGGGYEWFNRGGLHSAFAECASCTAERRLNGDGRPGSGEHGIAVDAHDNVWLTGNGDGDGQILKFTKDGKFLLQIGKGGVSPDSNDPSHLSRAAGITVYPKTNEVFVADGYGNRRVVVFDADTGAYKRHWGAYGNKPDDSVPRTRAADGPISQQFNTVHGIRISNDNLVYVGDRINNRIQVFTIEGKFVKEAYIERQTSSAEGTAFDIAFSPDKQQRFLYVTDGSNKKVQILSRDTLEVIGSFGGHGGHGLGEFYHAHSIASDSKGNIYVGESFGERALRWLYKGM